MSTPVRIHRLDYRPPAFLIPETRLVFDLRDDGSVEVRARLTLRRNPAAEPAADLRLDGEAIRLLSLRIDGAALPADRFALEDKSLTVRGVPDSFVLETAGVIEPEKNTELMGLYRSGRLLCTQNEPEGFRRITWFIDRPDVMSVFSVRIEAGPALPDLLCNGNRVETGALPGGRHFAEWRDPFPKPAYLFALVAGALGRIEDRFVTRSGRPVALRVFTDPGNEARARHAMESLKLAMRWDEQAYGLEYDLDLFMIVAVDAFNFGAMENKGLNIFNSANVLADPDTATDQDYDRIEAIVAHEYFHNYSGDRVTLRDWFQLTLKEGLTVFRDQEFTADHHSRPVQRIGAVRDVRQMQFAEDAGPNAHPIRPDSYVEINNFYTVTVYEKGAEIIRMLHTLAGPQGYRKATNLYFARHDGQAVTCEDFVRAVEDACGLDLARFRRWYAQAGTPVVELRGGHDPATSRFTLTARQSCPPTADGSPKEPLVIPMAVGLIGPDGRDLPLRLAGEASAAGHSRVLTIQEREQTFVFEDIAAPPVVSAFRGFSAPVRVVHAAGDDELAYRLSHDSDAFGRYDAGQALALRAITAAANALRRGGAAAIPAAVIDPFARAALDKSLDPAFRVELLEPPALVSICAELPDADYAAAFAAREAFEDLLAGRFHGEWLDRHHRLAGGAYARDAAACASRAFRNRCLQLLSRVPVTGTLALQRFRSADNMTDRMAALRALCDFNLPGRDEALAEFEARWRDNFLVMNKWFAVQVAARRGDALATVRRLAAHPLFDPRNPNRLRSVYSTFAGNLPHFHRADGAGYRLLAGAIREIDPVNSSVSAGLAKAYKEFARLPAALRPLMRESLQTISAAPNLSPGLREVVGNTLRFAE
ncbi:MAG: aminopeptidase N [Kiritimatiellia bacterium]